MKSYRLHLFIVSAFLLLPLFNFAQVPNLGSAESFAVFTSAGAFNNYGTTVITGDIGTNVGAFNGFPPGIVVGSIHVADPISAQAAVDVSSAYSYLDGLPCNLVLPATIGGGQILTANTYCISTAAVLNGNLILDGEGDPNARFIFQIDGAFSTSTLANITLINNASLCNVYWQVNGAFALGEGSNFKGTLLANGAISLLEGSTFEGHALTQAGAVELHNNLISVGEPPIPATITASSALTFCEGDSVVLSGNVDGVWNTGETTFSITVYTSGNYFVSNTNDCGPAISNVIVVVAEADILPPVLVCPQDISINCNDSILPAFTGSATATDDCDMNPVITYTDEIMVGSCLNNYDINRTWLAEDYSGNDTFCIQIIAVSDTTLPVITCPMDLQLACIDLTTPDVTGFATAIDNCDTTPAVSYIDVTLAGLCPDSYTIIRTWTALDNCSNEIQCVQNIEVLDTVAPAITCPPAITILCSEEVLPLVTGLATAVDLCDVTPVINYADVITPSVECLQNYVINRTWTALDVCGNASTCLQTITVLDNVAPIIICPVAISVECADLILPVDISLVNVTDNCGTTTVTFTGEAITNQICENNYLLTRTFLATDDCGNTATCQQLISVTDTLSPTITFNDPLLIGMNNTDTLVVQCYGQNPQWALPVFTTSSINATDVCEGDITLTYGKILLMDGICMEDGFIQLHEMTWTATDICGNVSSVTLIMKLVDTIAPTIVGLPDDITLDCESLIELPLNIIALDQCLCACVVVSEQTNLPIGCQDGAVITITWTAMDDCGNTTTEAQNITLIDTIGPVIEIVHPDILGIENGTIMEVECDVDGFPRFVLEMDKESVYSPDICGGSVLVDFEEEIMVSSDCKTTGIVEERTFLWTVTDLCGNQSTFTFSVRMIDTIAPVWVGVHDTVCIGSELLNGIFATDDCIDPYTQIKDVSVPNPCGTGFAIERRYKATDECGNTAVAKTLIVPNNQSVPAIFFNDTLLMNLEVGEVLITDCSVLGGQFTAFGIEDVYVEGVCAKGAKVTFTEKLMSTPNCIVDGIKAVVTLTWTVEDVCGNIASRTITANVMDNTPPVFHNFNAEMTIGCADSMPEIIASDLCGNVFISYRDTIMTSNCLNNYDVVRLITATDECANSISMEQVVHVGGNSGPVITGVEEHVCDDLSIPVVTAYDPCTEQFIPVSMTQDTADVICLDGLVIIRTWTAQDTCGRETVITQTIVMNDHTPPVLTLVGNSVIYQLWKKQQGSVYLWDHEVLKYLNKPQAYSVLVEDDCDQNIIPVFSEYSVFPEDCETAGYYERRYYTWIATDACDNADTLTIMIDIIDDIAPDFLNFPEDMTVYCAPLPPVTDPLVDDYTQSVSMTFTEVIDPVTDGRTFVVVRTWTATDACGNSTTKEQIITWIPDNLVECEIVIPELVTCNSHGVLLNGIISGGAGIQDYTWVIEGEECFIQGGQGTPWIEIYVGWSPVNVILTMTDSLGCVSVCTVLLECVSASNGENANEISNVGFTPLPELQWQLNSQSDGVELKNVTTYPNPATDGFNLSFLANGESTLTVNILNQLGKPVYTGKLNVQSGSNSHLINLPAIFPGNYVMQVLSDQHIYIHHLVIIPR